MRSLSKTLLIMFIALFGFMNVKAISVDSNNITIDSGKNDSIDVYANIDSTVTNIDFNLIYSTYDVTAEFTVNPDFTDTHSGGIKHGIILGEHEGGKVLLGTININVVDNPTVTAGTVSITSPNSKNANSESKSLNSQVINVNVNKKNIPEEVEPSEEEEQEDIEEKPNDYNLLKSIKSDIVNIKLKKDVFKYEVTINNDIQELDLKPVVINDNYKATISSQKISELKDNKIVIKVSNDKIEKEYEIKVKVSEEDVEKEDSLEHTESSTFKYKSKWVIIILFLVALLVLGVYLNKKKK